MLALALGCLVLGIAGGLARLGALLPALPASSIAHHGLVIVGGFFGTVIGLERAVAFGHPLALTAPIGAAAGGLLILSGALGSGAALLCIAAAAFVAVNVAIVRRQAAAHACILLVAAIAWSIGNLIVALGLEAGAAVPWWFAFLVVTIAAERLDLTRFMPRRAHTLPLLAAVLIVLIAGAALRLAHVRLGEAAFGLGLIALAAWLLVFDVAAKTRRTQGLPRFIAFCLLGGYGWLAVAGAAWIAAAAFDMPMRDVAIHALGLGFVISMILGHAPVILPAIARIRPRFNRWFYLPLLLLHASLLIRFGGALLASPAFAWGAMLNASALAVFAIVLICSLARRS